MTRNHRPASACVVVGVDGSEPSQQAKATRPTSCSSTVPAR